MTTPIPEAKVSLAKFNITPALAVVEPIQHLTLGTMTVALLKQEHHVSLPLYLKNSKGRIGRYVLVKVAVPDELTKRDSRKAINMWLLMSCEAKLSGANNEYVGNNNAGRLRELEEYIGETGKARYNAAIVTGSWVPMQTVPTEAYVGEGRWVPTVYNVLTKPANEMLLGKRIGPEPDDITWAAPNTPEYTKFMNEQHEKSEALLRIMLAKGLTERNYVFYCENNGFIPTNITFNTSANGVRMLTNKEYRVKQFCDTGLFSGTIRIHKDVTSEVTKNGTELEFGLRIIGEQRNAGRYRYEGTGSTFDRFGQVIRARLSCTDSLTIDYLEKRAAAANKTPQTASDVAKEEISVLPGSRASRLAQVIEERSEFIQFKNATLRIHHNRVDDKDKSMAINIEYVLDDSSEYFAVENKSKMNQLAVVGDEFMDMFDDAGISDEEVAKLLEANNTASVVVPENKKGKVKEAELSIEGLDDDEDEIPS